MAIQTRITQRFDVLSNWIQNDIVLLQGELAVVDCGSQTRFKVGDGTKRFTQLPFVDQNQLCTRWIAADAVSQGLHASSVPYGFAAGAYLCANANFSQALGFDAKTISSDTYSFVWNGDDTRAIEDYYASHGKGTFSVNPLSGLSGVFIGEKNLAKVLDENSGNKITIDDRISGICKQTDLSIVRLSAEDYSGRVARVALLSNALYVVEGAYEDVHGQQIKNLAPGTDLSDAINLEQLTEVSARAYEKSETSSAAQISAADYALSSEISAKTAISVDGEFTGEFKFEHISLDEYIAKHISGVIDGNTMYDISSENMTVFGGKIVDLAPGEDPTDAVNRSQLAEVSSRAYDTYTKIETDQKIASAQYFKKYVVQTLPPVADADERGIYLVPSSDPESQNTYDEYVVVGEGSSKAWEKIGAKNIDLSGYKTKQTAKTDPTASGSATSFIDTITQDENGVITATKKNVRAASTTSSGIVQLNNALTSTSTAQAATANAVKLTNDKFADYSLTSHTHSNYVLTSRTVAGQQLTANVTAATISSAIGLGNYMPATGISKATDVEVEIKSTNSNGDAWINLVGGNGAHSLAVFGGSAGAAIWVDDIYEQTLQRKDGVIALTNDLGYALSTATGVLSSGSYVYDIADRTMTTIGINQSSTPVIVRLPDAGNGARDFILRIEISSETAPTFTFINTAGLDFESEDDDWAIMEPGVNLVSFTETKR